MKKIQKMTIANANPVTFKFYEFFSAKIRGNEFFKKGILLFDSLSLATVDTLPLSPLLHGSSLALTGIWFFFLPRAHFTVERPSRTSLALHYRGRLLRRKRNLIHVLNILKNFWSLRDGDTSNSFQRPFVVSTFYRHPCPRSLLLNACSSRNPAITMTKPAKKN